MILGKLFGSTRGAARWLGRRPDILAGISAVVLYVLLPAVLGLDYRLLAPKGSYRLMWLNLLGAHYRLPIETPKPLTVLLAGLLGSGPAFYAVTCAMVGLCVVLAMRMGKVITGSFWPGLVTAFLDKGNNVDPSKVKIEIPASEYEKKDSTDEAPPDFSTPEKK